MVDSSVLSNARIARMPARIDSTQPAGPTPLAASCEASELLELGPLELLEKLAALTPRPWINLVLFRAPGL